MWIWRRSSKAAFLPLLAMSLLVITSAFLKTTSSSTVRLARASHWIRYVTNLPQATPPTKAKSGKASEALSATETLTSVSNDPFKSNTGGLRRLPVVKSPEEIVNKAKKMTSAVAPRSSIKNARDRARKHGTETLNTLTQALCVPLRDIVKGYKTELNRLHPFERVVAELTARARQKKDGITLENVLDDIHEARKEVLEAGKDWVAYAKTAPTARDASAAMKDGTVRLCNLFDEICAPYVLQIVQLQQSLRNAPCIRLDTPAIVLVGSPNVGKSSIVRKISSGTPEINNYPFTTRGMTLGHVEVFWSDENTIAKSVVPKPVEETTAPKFHPHGGTRIPEQTKDFGQESRYAFSQLCQVMDSPGLLVRADHERNEMEALTLAAMRHLPTAVMYVMDLSGEAGDKCSSIEDQLQLREEVRKRFPRRPWIDVVSKYDMGVVNGSLEKLEEILDGAPYIKLSIHDGTGVEELKSQVLRMLGEVRVVLDAMGAVDKRSARPTVAP